MPYGKPLFTSEWMPLREAASVLGCHPLTIANRIRSGKMLGVRMVNLDGLNRINRSDWQSYLESRQTVAQKAA